MNEIFSDHFARRENLLTQVDARIKTIFVVDAILAVVSAAAPYAPLIVILLSLGSLFTIGIPFKIICIRLSAPFGIAITIIFIKIFFYREGFRDGILMMSKIIGSTSLVLFLSMTTTLDKLLAASRWFKVPGTWVEICLLAYRYIFVLLEDAVTVFDAQRIRLGYTDLRKALYSIGTLAGTIIIRAYDQSVSTYEAMMLRGYKGKAEALSLEDRLMLKDAVAAFIFIAILVSLLILNRTFKI